MLNDNELLFDELYEKTKDCGRVQFINLLMEKERENNELKEYFEAAKEVAQEHKKNEIKLKDRLEEQRKEYQETYKDVRVEIKEYKSQQKEFIEYLEDYIDALKQQKETVEGLDIGEEHILMILEEVLEKYKGIIGGSNENNSI